MSKTQAGRQSSLDTEVTPPVQPSPANHSDPEATPVVQPRAAMLQIANRPDWVNNPPAVEEEITK